MGKSQFVGTERPRNNLIWIFFGSFSCIAGGNLTRSTCSTSTGASTGVLGKNVHHVSPTWISVWQYKGGFQKLNSFPMSCKKKHHLRYHHEIMRWHLRAPPPQCHPPRNKALWVRDYEAHHYHPLRIPQGPAGFPGEPVSTPPQLAPRSVAPVVFLPPPREESVVFQPLTHERIHGKLLQGGPLG